MNITEQVKELIANGKTEEALEWLQSILKEKDTNLLNQTYLLQSQYLDIQKRLRLGLQDASTELQRVNFTLLTICDDVEKAGITGEKSVKKQGSKSYNHNNNNDTDNSDDNRGSLKTTYWVFGIIVFIAIASIVALVIYSKGDTRAAIKSNQNNDPNPSMNSKSNNKMDWAASPASTKILYPRYGNFNIDIKNIVVETKDANNKTITITLKLTCKETTSGSCIASYLKYRLLELDGDKKPPISDATYGEITPKSGANTEGVVTFLVPNTMRQADLAIFYTGEENTTQSIFKLRQK